ncbi:hypothetical protein Asp14428_68390 [Actinoplanes sp. NBRC 14428]|nr:hypothetical protein Asp14428_68390 [Actinoplanes sp. NBRC 14428]
MRHVPPQLAALTAQAQTLTAEGDLAGARAVLDGVLDPAETDPQRASPDLALAAALHARILIALGDAHAARIWAGFAHAAEERLHGPHDERTIAAAATHAAVLHRVGNFGRAAQLYHDLVAELTALDGPLSTRVLAAEADLATAEHAAGHCTAARARLADAWTRHREVHGDDSAAGIKMLARLGAMERECARDGEAGEHLALAQELCARYLPADHSLAQQIARLATGPVSGRHQCGRVQRSAGPLPDGPAAGVSREPAPAARAAPAVPQPWVPASRGAPGTPPPMDDLAPGDLTGRHARPEPPVPLPLTSPAPAPPDPEEPEPQAGTVYFPPAQRSAPPQESVLPTPPAEWPARGRWPRAWPATRRRRRRSTTRPATGRWRRETKARPATGPRRRRSTARPATGTRRRGRPSRRGRTRRTPCRSPRRCRTRIRPAPGCPWTGRVPRSSSVRPYPSRLLTGPRAGSPSSWPPWSWPGSPPRRPSSR